MNDDDRFSNVLSSPVESLICVELAVKGRTVVPDEEKRRDYLFSQLSNDFATMSGELFGRNGSGGFVGEVRASLTKIDNKQDRLQEQVGCLQREMSENKVSTDDQIVVLHNKVDQAHVRIDNIEPRVKTVEEMSGVRAQKVIAVVAKTAAVAAIGGAVAHYLF